MSFLSELEDCLPDDLPNRERCARVAALHLEAIVAANQYMNLTRIVGEREAAIKHVADSVMPWRLFAGAKVVADAGTGAGFPGIPLAAVLPETRFILLESVQKKARFVEQCAASLDLPNVEVRALRAEAWLAEHAADVITARAVAPLAKIVPLFKKSLQAGSRMLLYKGLDVAAEMEEAGKCGVSIRVLEQYELPGGMGSRSIVELKAL